MDYKYKNNLKKLLKWFLAFVCFMSMLVGMGFVNEADIYAETTSLATLIANVDETGIVTITEDITLTSQVTISRDITIRSEEGSHYTIYAPSSRHITFSGTGTLTLENITLDGAGTNGGVVVNNGGTLVLGDGAIISNNYQANMAGGVYIAYGHLHMLSGSKVISNEVGNGVTRNMDSTGGGVYISGTSSSFVMEKGALIEGNLGHIGAGIYVYNAKATIRGTVTGNKAYKIGGGLHYYQTTSAASLVIEGAVFSDNISYGYSTSSTRVGGAAIAIRVTAGNDITIKDTLIINNSSLTTADVNANNGSTYGISTVVGGGGILAYTEGNVTAKMNIIDSDISGNIAGLGGGIYSIIDTEIVDTTISNNVASHDRFTSESTSRNDNGGGIYFSASRNNVYGVGTLWIKNGIISNNVANIGAGVYVTSGEVSDVYIDGTQFSGNSIREFGYAWDVDNPLYAESSSSGGTNYAEIYKNTITNVTTVTEPYTNLYNNADINFSLNRHIVFDVNGGVFGASFVTFYLNYLSSLGYSVTLSDDYFDSYNRIDLEVANGAVLTGEIIPVRAGYDFIGWVDENNEYMGDTVVMLQHRTYTAVWLSKTVTVSYQNESGTIDYEVIPRETSYVLSSQVPQREGYTFVGWETTDGVYPAGSEYVLGTTNVVFVAKWEEISEEIIDDDKDEEKPKTDDEKPTDEQPTDEQPKIDDQTEKEADPTTIIPNDTDDKIVVVPQEPGAQDNTVDQPKKTAEILIDNSVVLTEDQGTSSTVASSSVTSENSESTVAEPKVLEEETTPSDTQTDETSCAEETECEACVQSQEYWFIHIVIIVLEVLLFLLLLLLLWLMKRKTQE